MCTCEAITAINRYAHRARLPGRAKVKFRIKSEAIRRAVKAGHAEVEGWTVVSTPFGTRRVLAVKAECGARFHATFDLLTSGEREREETLYYLPFVPSASVRVSRWSKPEMTEHAALKQLNMAIVLCECPRCGCRWRYDVGMYWSRTHEREERICPDCFRARRQERAADNDYDYDGGSDWMNEDEE